MFTLLARGSVTTSARSVRHVCETRTIYRYTESQPPHRRFFATEMSAERHHFAPLGTSSSGSDTGLMRLQGVVFDMDGTLCESIAETCSPTHARR